MSVSTERRFVVGNAGVNPVFSPGHLAFAAIMIFLGIQGLIKHDFTVIWQGVPKGVPAREVLGYLCALVSLGCGIGLLWRRRAGLAARVLLVAFVLWFLLWRVRPLFRLLNVQGSFAAAIVDSTWSAGETLVMAGAAWVLFAWFATDWDRQRLGFATGERGVRIARVLYGLGLIPFGYAHFGYLDNTTILVPNWLPWHTFWAYFTGATFIVAGVAIAIGVFGRLAAVLSVWQMGLFFLLVWVPRVVHDAAALLQGRAGNLSAFQWGEVVANLALVAAGWVVAESYRGVPWLAVGKRQRAT